MIKALGLIVFFVIVILGIECKSNQSSNDKSSNDGDSHLIPNIEDNLNKGLEDAHNQIGVTNGYIEYYYTDKGHYSGTVLNYKLSNILYVNDELTSFKRTSALLLNGVSKNDTTQDITYNNEVVEKAASEGSIVKTDSFPVNGVSSKNYTAQEVEDAGFAFYKFDYTVKKLWTSTNWGNGNGEWEDILPPSFIVSYFLIKKTDDELVLIVASLGNEVYSISEELENPTKSSVFKNIN